MATLPPITVAKGNTPILGSWTLTLDGETDPAMPVLRLDWAVSDGTDGTVTAPVQSIYTLISVLAAAVPTRP